MRIKMKEALIAAATAGLILMGGSAWAGDAVRGSGSSPADAMRDADERARTESARRFGGNRNCYTPSRYESCQKDSNGYYVCVAYVANHQGSCR